MATAKTETGGVAFGGYEPSLTTTFLPRCPGCSQPHPRSKAGGDLDTNTCQNCGTTCPVGSTKTTTAVLAGFSPSILAGRFLLWAGRTLFRLAKDPEK